MIKNYAKQNLHVTDVIIKWVYKNIIDTKHFILYMLILHAHQKYKFTNIIYIIILQFSGHE